MKYVLNNVTVGNIFTTRLPPLKNELQTTSGYFQTKPTFLPTSYQD